MQQSKEKVSADNLTFVLSGNSSQLSCIFNPTIYLDGDYEICLVNLQAYNSIANVTSDNNVFRYNAMPKKKQARWKEIKVPYGTYDIDDLHAYILDQLQKLEGKDVTFELNGNTNTMKVSVKSNIDIDFEQDNSIGSLFGFEHVVLIRDEIYYSEKILNINKVNAIDVVCSIVEGSFVNGIPSHILYHFYPNVAPGYKIIEVPQEKIYMPVNSSVLTSITIKLVDQGGRLVDFKGEEITLYLRLRRRGTH